jgi:amino acid adenylation domain-containing protein
LSVIPPAPPEVKGLSREEKLALLARLAEERARARRAEAEQAPRTYPLAFAQQRFWFLHQLDPGSHADHIFRALRLQGLLLRGALEGALAELVQRHDALRTRFPAADGEPRQVVEPARPGAARRMPLIDLSGLAPGTVEPAAVALASAESRRPFDLARGPLFRALLLRLGRQDHVLLLGLHHILADGWSLGLLLQELAQLYGAAAAAGPPPPPAPRARFGDFARAQRERLRGEALSREIAFWRERLAGAPALLELPADHPRRAAASPRGDTVWFGVPAAATVRLKALAQAAGATSFMALLALFDLLLFRYSGQGDLVVGVPVANRDRTGMERVVGCFSSTLLVRVEVRRGMSFRALLSAVRRESLAVFAHSELPFEKLVEELAPERNLLHNPLFQVMFALQPAGVETLAMAGLEISPLEVERGLAKLDLTLEMIETRGAEHDGNGRSPAGSPAAGSTPVGGDPVAPAPVASAPSGRPPIAAPSGAASLSGYFEYSTDLFEEATIARLARHFEALLTAALAEPERPVGELPLLAPEERRQLLVDWNRPFLGVPPPVVYGVAAQARRTPEAPAVLFGAERLSYAELERGANRLARKLRRLGVGPERSVGVCLERALEMPMVLLAVLKSGGAWVPLDPEYPRERLALMIADSPMPVLLTQKRLAERLPPPADSAGAAGGPAVLAVDRLDLSAEDDGEPEWEIPPESLAYIVYTSGSTGRPKGVAVPHSSVANHVHACAERYRLGPDDRVLQFTSISFDITSEEIFPTWLCGGAVVPRPPGLFPSFGELAELITRHGITVVDLPTAYWHEWVGELQRARTPPPEPLRLVVIGTEQALPERVADWLDLAGDRVRLNNSYASTEATVTSVVYEPAAAERARFRAGDRVPVGKNLRNCCAYVLDAGLEPVPAGVPGDIYIGGPNVSRGYANWPDRTAASFVPDPFAAELGYGPGRRMYRQGDVGRWLPSGDLQYLGRRDDMVKIRGFRVEPAEVGAALARHPAVKDCAVVVRDDGPLGKRLVGYLTLAPGRTAAVAELRDFLRRSLPEHMVPAALVTLDALPLTSNGRVDQRALPSPAAAERTDLAGAGGLEGDGRRASLPPRGAAEEILAGIWCEVLGLPRVGAGDHFFDLGGHSLLGTQVVSRARARLGVEVPLRALFENPVLADLARRVEELRRAGALEGPPPIAPVERGGPLALSFSQQRLWLLDRLEPGKATYNMPFVLHLAGTLDAGAFAAALGEIVRRHEILRTTFAEQGGVPHQLVHPPAAPRALPVVDLSGLDSARREAEAGCHIGREARRPFDLARGPVLRAALLRLAADEHVLLATLHHIAGDGWSFPILWGEMSQLYAGRALPQLPVQYADFAAWQRRWLSGATLAAALAHWRERLRGLPPLITLPTDRPRPAAPTWRGAVRGLALGSELFAALQATSRKLGATPFMLVLAGAAALLRRHGAQASLAIGVPVAGRGRVETEPLIGCFVNTLVMRCDVAAAAPLTALVEQVRETVLDGDVHQELPFEKLVEELSPERSLSHAPLFQVMLAYQNLPRRELSAGDLRVTPIGSTSGTAKFDLTFSLQADGDEAALFVEYSTELFDAATVDRLARHFSRLLAGAAAAPERPIGELPLLTPAEWHQMVREWNPAPAPAGAEAVAGHPAEPFERRRDTAMLGHPTDERGRAALHVLFEAQVERAPERLALTVPAPSPSSPVLTYRELDARANRLARHLRAAGVRPGELVGLCFERSAELVVALLATLKAGAAYLPLDPAAPAERIAFALSDSGARVVLSVAALAGALPPGVRVIAVDAEAAAIAGHDPRPLGLPADPDLPAYVIYTSGSTGRPKGVVVPHGHVSRLFSATAPWFGFGPDDVWTLFHSYAFDFSVWEIWGALLHGGRLVIVPHWESRSPEAFYALLRAERVTVLNQTPSAFRQLVWAEESALGGEIPAGPPAGCPAIFSGVPGGSPALGSGVPGRSPALGPGVPGGSPALGPGAPGASPAISDAPADHPTPCGLDDLRLVIFGGEALDLSTLAPWFARHGDRRPRLVNMYGITETTVHVTYRPLAQADLAAGRGSVLGAPIPDLTLHVADRDLAPRPIGVPGELVVGGEGVASGYLARPELTAERFVPDPHGAPGARLYRSGDLARRLSDGDVEYLGRIDHQVKIRGFRIELGEIEAALSRHPALAAVVVALRAEGGDPRLAAYYVPAGSDSDSGAAAATAGLHAELRESLRRALPEYMIPAWFVPLAALPLTANDKVDRQALPAPGAGAGDPGREHVPPTGSVEQRVAAVWREVLRREPIGARDNFFELGGHSLLATQVLARLRAAFGVDLALRAVFEAPTVAGIAELIVQKELEQADGDLLARLLGELEGEPGGEQAGGDPRARFLGEMEGETGGAPAGGPEPLPE